jgi:hypothetical protein
MPFMNEKLHMDAQTTQRSQGSMNIHNRKYDFSRAINNDEM